MKIINQILITLFVVVAVFVARDDIKSAYNHGLVYMENKVEGILNINLKNKKDNIADSNSNKSALNTESSDDKIAVKAETPGPLKVLNDLLSSNQNKTKLSSKAIIELTNQARMDNGSLPPLKENSKLDLSAKQKLDDMFAKQYFEHTSPSGIGVVDLGDQVGYEYLIIGENLAMGNFNGDKALVDAWMASPGHRANILNKHYTEIGVAVEFGIYDGKSIWMAVQHFGLPRSVCNQTDDILRGSIMINQENIKSMEDELSIRKQYIDSGAVYKGMTTSEQIEQYNALINTHNEAIIDMRVKINTYNAQVRDFNACVANNTL